MTLSNRISQTNYKLRHVYDGAFARAGVPLQLITSEYLDTARRLLNLGLSAFAADAIALWTNDRIIVGMRSGQPKVVMPAGTIEVERVVLNMCSSLPTTLSGTSPVWVASAAAAQQFVGIKVSASGAYDIGVAVSENGVTYTSLDDVLGFNMVANQYHWIEINPDDTAAFYIRLTELNSASFPVTSVRTATEGSERPLSILGADDYAYLPNKRQSGSVTSFWVDRRLDQPTLMLWNAPNDTFGDYFLTVWRKRHIMDVGTMAQGIEVPQRWMDAIIWDLAWRLTTEIPEAKKSPEQLLPYAQRARSMIEVSETDGGVLSMMPNNSAYTK